MKRLYRPLIAALIALVLGVPLIGGCGLHTPGGVRVDQRSVDTAADDPDILKLPPGPVSDGAPDVIVRGFLVAAAADPDHTIAQDFLAPEAVWNNSEAATVYDPESVSAFKIATTKSVSRVTFTARSLGTVTAGGAFLPLDRAINADFELRRTDGQWRLTRVPAGVLLTPRDLTRSYRPVLTYNLDANRSLLVPEPGYVVSDRAGLATAALHAFLTNWGGDGRSGEDSFRELAPGLSALGSVVVTDGEATVDLGREAFNVPPQERPLLVAQIAASLGSVPGVFTVRVLVEERPYIGGAVSATIPTDLTETSTGPALGVGAFGGIVKLAEPSAGPATSQIHWVPQTPPGFLSAPVSAPGGARIAALQFDSGTQDLVLAQIKGSPSAVTSPASAVPVTATDVKTIRPKPAPGTQGVPLLYLPPQWVDADRLLLPSVSAGVARLQLVDALTGSVDAVSTPGLAKLGPLSAFVVSRDGTRAVAVAGEFGARRVYLGRVVRVSAGQGHPDGVVVAGWTPVPTSMADVDAVSWSSDLSITVLGSPLTATASTPRRAAVIALDTVAEPTPLPDLPPAFSAADELTGPDQAITISTAPGRPTLVGLDGQTWQLQSGSWLAVRGAATVSYP